MNNVLNNFNQLVAIMKRLRAPNGCPWDAEQTHESLKRYLLEETYEVMEAIDANSDELLKEELGDLLLQPIFHAAIAEERNAFNIDDVIRVLIEKLIRRHPHVFGNEHVKDSATQIINWEKIKKTEKGADRRSALSGVPPHLPALMKAHKITEKASRVGFDWEHVDQVMAKVIEELHEFEAARAAEDQEQMESELGDLLFALANLGRFLAIDPEEALRKTIRRFESRFTFIEEQLQHNGKSLQSSTLDEMETLWQQAKQLEKKR